MLAHRLIIMALGLFITVGCTGPTIEKGRTQSADPVVGMLHQGIIELNGSIEELTHHLSDLQKMPPVSDPNIQELHALDMAGWELHLQITSFFLSTRFNECGLIRARKPQLKANGAIAKSNSSKHWKS
jgi:hypothetical protein